MVFVSSISILPDKVLNNYNCCSKTNRNDQIPSRFMEAARNGVTFEFFHLISKGAAKQVQTSQEI